MDVEKGQAGFSGIFGKGQKFLAVDADSVDSELRRIIIDACIRYRVNALFVSDRRLSDVLSAEKSYGFIRQVVVQTDFDSADDFLFQAREGIFLCVTHDRILQRKLQDAGVDAIDKRGSDWPKRSYGKMTAKDVEMFSNALDARISAFAAASKAHRFEDYYGFEYHGVRNHPRSYMSKRAAQFRPFNPLRAFGRDLSEGASEEKGGDAARDEERDGEW